MLVLSGYHIIHFFIHVFNPNRRNDFIEMALHHLVTVYLLIGQYLMNLLAIGSGILFLHDLSDIFVCIVKLAGETEYDALAALCMIVHMIVWAHTRLITFGYTIYQLATSDAVIGTYAKSIFVYLLCCLFLLHCFWFTLFVRMIYSFATEGVVEDIQQATEVNEKKKK